MGIPENIESKFRFILVAAKRARQLQAGSKPLMQTTSKKSTRMAQQEVGAGLVPIEIIPLAANGEKEDSKKKPAK